MRGHDWRSLLWDLPDVIAWVTDDQGNLTISEGGGLRSIQRGAGDNVGVHLSAFGDTSDGLWRTSWPEAQEGRTSFAPSVYIDDEGNRHAYVNFCGPRLDGRGKIIGMVGFSQEVTDGTLRELERTVAAIKRFLEGSDA